MFDLREQLSDDDKKKLESYICTYGIQKENFIGVDDWLCYWSKNNIKLYKLLGNKFIHKIPFCYEKDKTELNSLIGNELLNEPFINHYMAWVCSYFHRNNYDYEAFYNNMKCSPRGVGSCFKFVWKHQYFIENKIDFSLKYKDEKHKKTLQISKGEKPVKALQKIYNYFKDDIGNLDDEFEHFRLTHSKIFNDKTMKGDLVFSIHPLDFITMSDNASRWTSCMSWEEEGCYRVGTIEMMNSNNVICCYIENSAPFVYDETEDPQTGEIIGCWNNKRWRELVYVTKDIITCGKSYPYSNHHIDEIILNELKKLASDNLNWNYSFGPEKYLDMKHITGYRSIERAKEYVANYQITKEPIKYNIFFDTKGMYNDMLNDKNTTYLCIRNKVSRPKVISYSGKANCLCCNKEITYKRDEYEILEANDWEQGAAYNERYGNVDALLCEDCLDEFRCEVCNCSLPKEKFTLVNTDWGEKRVCSKCIESYYKCPLCNKYFELNYYDKFHPKTYYLLKDAAADISALEKDLRKDLKEPAVVYDGNLFKDTENKVFNVIKPFYVHRGCIDEIDNAKVIPYCTEKERWDRRVVSETYSIYPNSIEDKASQLTYNNLIHPKEIPCGSRIESIKQIEFY